MSCPALHDGFDPTDPEINQAAVPLPEFAELRRTAPVCWIPQADGTAGFDDGGYWAVTRHADVKEVSTHPETFSSSTNTAIIRFHPSIQRDAIDSQRLIMLNMDPPEHTRLRSIVQRGFTPRAINALQDTLRDRAERIVHSAVKEGTGDFVADVACELPLQAIAELIGVPQQDRGKIFHWTNTMVGYDDPELAISTEKGMESAAELMMYAMGMAEERKGCPADDIVTKLVNASGQGNLSSDEFGFFVLVLAVAGNETTRNATSHGMHAMLTHPEQWELYKERRPQTAADEIVRWATPVISFQRTATGDTELGGQQIREGQRVGIFYASANNDEEVFADPRTFDVLRDPNPHLGFGGGGPHFCLGANLARLEIDLIFNAIADAMPNIRLTGEPRRLRSPWLNGIKRLDVQYA
ncbi:cytochrome P450 [Streptacidiphilus fuscans]|uniref:Cytochrome P450 n=1 Tax=Streptacidiphilus fuscans TaxID=2789292 RepID=A0A931FFQ1_9ACTN|nr:cytochrome P450 [Streptacidiphilus fuscans]MBF9073097.1 cytochrome P450 [Streptacidiphilus fuscans]